MDHVVNAAERHMSAEEDANTGSCYEVAQINGLTLDQADNCEEMKDGYGKFRCAHCPWQPNANNSHG